MKKVFIITMIVALLVSIIVAGAACVKAKPKAGFSANPISGTTPLTVQFTDESTGEITDWAWDFDNNRIVDSTMPSPSHTYTSSGTYTVSLTITGPGGTDTQARVDYISVTQAPPTTTSVSPNQGHQGQTLNNVTIAGTYFSGAIAVSLGAGITVSGFTVDSETQITANITIAAAAETGPRDVSVTTPGGTGTLPSGFTIELGVSPDLTISFASPGLPPGWVGIPECDYFYAVVNNIGLGDASSTEVLFVFNYGTRQLNDVIGFIPAGGYNYAIVSWWFEDLEPTSAEITVDPNNKIVESCEYNNYYHWEYNNYYWHQMS